MHTCAYMKLQRYPELALQQVRRNKSHQMSGSVKSGSYLSMHAVCLSAAGTPWPRIVAGASNFALHERYWTDKHGGFLRPWELRSTESTSFPSPKYSDDPGASAV